VKRISVGGSLARVALGALVEAAREMLEDGTFTYASRALPSAEVERLLG
jgi:2-methylisocitrate lyase-like PEP mutase family enzyme